MPARNWRGPIGRARVSRATIRGDARIIRKRVGGVFRVGAGHRSVPRVRVAPAHRARVIDGRLTSAGADRYAAENENRHGK